MTFFQISALLVSLTAIFSYLNYKLLRLPATIGVMLIALLFSLVLTATGHFIPSVSHTTVELLEQFDFDKALMQGMLCFLLFAGALHVNLNDLSEHKLVVAALALVGVAISMFVFATLIYFALGWLGIALPYSWCLLFGALISPTDPVAVLGILKESKVPRSLEVQIAGESLFNDGIGVVAFIVMEEIALSGAGISFSHIGQLFLEEAIGGAIFGFAIGWITFRLLRSVDNYRVEVLLTLGLVMGGYALASALHLSGPIAIVVAGLFIGNHGRALAMSEVTRHNLDAFWELVDEILNAVLFVLIGLEIIALSYSWPLLAAGALAIPAILLARWLSVAGPVNIMRLKKEFSPGSIRIMTWGGLRGGISVALALSLPPGPYREIILSITYVIVIFSILGQGLSLQTVVRASTRKTSTV